MTNHNLTKYFYLRSTGTGLLQSLESELNVDGEATLRKLQVCSNSHLLKIKAEDVSVCHSLSLKQIQGFELHCDLFIFVLSPLNLFYFLLSITRFNVLFLDAFLSVLNVFDMHF